VVAEIRLYFEGDKWLLRGFRKFFSELHESARKNRVRFKLIAGGHDAVGGFMKGIRINPDYLHLLLIDSEGPDNGKLFANLSGRKNWTPPRPSPVSPESVLWMVQCMESWFLADPEALSAYYGKDFAASKLPQNVNVEAVDKDQVIRSLEEASRDTKKGKYHKTKHAPFILEKISPARARSASHCERAFEILSRIINQ
jgi:hypothetical protein